MNPFPDAIKKIKELSASANKFLADLEAEGKGVRAVNDRAAHYGNEAPEESTVKEILSGTRRYRPLLTDLAARFPWVTKIPFGVGQSVSDVIGSMARAAKNQVGTIDENISERSPALLGDMIAHEKTINSKYIEWSTRANELGQLERKHLTPDQYKAAKLAKLNGKIHDAFAIYRTVPEADALIAAYRESLAVKKEALDYARKAGMEIGEVDNYFRRKVFDRESLAKVLGKDGISAYTDAVAQRARDNNGKVTDEEKDEIMNSILAGNARGGNKAGFAKQRRIADLTEEQAQWYEDPDIADDRYIFDLVRNVENRKAFGRAKPDDKIEGEFTIGNKKGVGGTFGSRLRKEFADKKINEQDLNHLTKALHDYYSSTNQYDEQVHNLARNLRKAQTFAYLADAISSLTQFGDIATSMYKFGVKNTATSYFAKDKIRLEDIGVTEGHAEHLQGLEGRRNRPDRTTSQKVISAAGKVYETSMKQTLGRFDQLNKSGLNKTAHKWVQGVINNPKSDEFKSLDRYYSEVMPERWPQIKEDLKSKDFAEGKLNSNTSLFLFSELGRLQPISMLNRAQGYVNGGPMKRLLYTLRGFGIKQISILRADAYNNLKAGRTVEGLAQLAAYATFAGIGQQAFSYLKDKILGRKQPIGEYAAQGLLQLALIPRSAILGFTKDPAGSILSAIVPGTGVARDIAKDTQLVLNRNQRDSEGNKLAPNVSSLFKKAKTVQYLPIVGRGIYWRFGAGAEAERKQAQKEREGKPQKGTFEAMYDIINAPDLKSPRK
jgi:hypothetical protein